MQKRKRRNKKKETRDDEDENRNPRGCMEAAIVRMRGKEMKYLTSKILTTTDLNKDHNRLLLPKDETKTSVLPYLKLWERRELEKKGGEIEVKVLDSLGREYEMKFKYWGSNKAYILNGCGWRDFLDQNNKSLKEGDNLPLYAFRSCSHSASGDDGELCMAMPILTYWEKKARREEEEDEREREREQIAAEGLVALSEHILPSRT